MKTFNRSTFEQLSEIKSDYAVSIYIPTQEVGDNRNKSMTRLKNHVQKTERELEAMGVKPREIKDFLEPIKKMLDDSTLFRELDQSLVVFRCILYPAYRSGRVFGSISHIPSFTFASVFQ